VGVLGRLARFHDASPGTGRLPGPTGPRLLSPNAPRSPWARPKHARLSRSRPSPPLLPPRRTTWLSFHSDFGSVSVALGVYPLCRTSTRLTPASRPAQPPLPLHPSLRPPPSIDLSVCFFLPLARSRAVLLDTSTLCAQSGHGRISECMYLISSVAELVDGNTKDYAESLVILLISFLILSKYYTNLLYLLRTCLSL